MKGLRQPEHFVSPKYKILIKFSNDQIGAIIKNKGYPSLKLKHLVSNF